MTSDSLYRKRIHFSYPIVEYWVEGIGSESGWFGHNYVASTINSYLECFSHKDESIYGDLGCYCETPSAVNEKIILEKQYEIMPNPAQNKVLLIFKTKENRKITIVDLLGKVVYSETFSENQLKINTSNIKRGVYLLKTSENNLGYKKLILN